MPSLNKVMLMGNVTRDIDLRHTPGGTAVCDVGLAINEKIKRGDKWEDEVTYTDVTFWGRQAETLAQYLKKGDPFFCEGKLRQESYEKDGKTVRKTKVRGETFQFLPNGRSGGKSEPAPPPRPARPNNPPADSTAPAALDEADEIPF